MKWITLLTILIIIVVIVIISIVCTLVFIYLRKSKAKKTNPETYSGERDKTVLQQSPTTKHIYSTCPNCNTRYSDITLKYCLIDGTLLILPSQDNGVAIKVTIKSPENGE